MPTSAGPTSLSANLGGAKLNGANLSGANIRCAETSAMPTSAVPTSAMPTSAVPNLSQARVGWTTFGNVDLSSALGLGNLRDDGPSTIGIDTLYRRAAISPKPSSKVQASPKT